MKIIRMISAFTVFLLIWPSYSDARIYKWKDENGKWQMSDTPPAQYLTDGVEEVKLKDQNQKTGLEEYYPEYQKNPEIDAGSFDENNKILVCRKAAANYKNHMPKLFGSLDKGVDKSNRENKAKLDKLGRVTYEISRDDFIQEFVRQCRDEWDKYSSVMVCMARASNGNAFIGCAAQVQGIPELQNMRGFQ